MFIGCHLSNARGFSAMGADALHIGANTFAFFTRNPRGGSAKEIDPDDAQALMSLITDHAFGPLVAHAPYTLNACSSDPIKREFARICMRDDLLRMEQLPGQFYNFHPGCHVGQGIEMGILQTINLLNESFIDQQSTTLLIETMAGQGSEIGSTFEQIAEIISRVTQSNKIGVCMDTCHVFAAGYDVKNDLDGVLTHFDKTIGLRFLKALHLNDSMQPLGSHRDRHARIGEGEIGLDACRRIVRHPALCNLPFILETPNELTGYSAEIHLLQE
ncbi:MAG: deoxyribonuclease IV [Clostridia bacterium]